MKRKKPRSPIGRLLRAWWQIRVALRLVRIVRRSWTAIRVAAVTAALGGFVALARALRRRRPSPTYSPPPSMPAGFGGGTRKTGYEAGPGTQTERELEVEKAEEQS